MKYGFSIGIIAFFIGFSAAAYAETVAIFAPNLDFKNGAERNAYVSKIAKALSSATDLDWEGKAYARASDFESAKSGIDVAILDADYFSHKSGSFKPAAMLSANGQTMRPFKVIAKKGGSDKLYDYRGKRLAVVANTSLTKSFVTASALGNETKAADYFSAVDEVRDVRSAINAIEVGKADLSLVYDGYDAGFTTIYTSPAVALPVVAVNTSRLTGQKAEKVRAALLDIDVRASSFITGTASYNAKDASAFKRVALTRKSTDLNYLPIDSDTEQIPFAPAKIVERNEGIFFNPFQVQYIPTLKSFDKVLEQKL